MFTVDKLPKTISLGSQSEAAFDTFELDVSAWRDTVPTGHFKISYRRPLETNFVDAELLEDNTTVLWELPESIREIAGAGELVLTLGELETRVRYSMTPSSWEKKISEVEDVIVDDADVALTAEVKSEELPLIVDADSISLGGFKVVVPYGGITIRTLPTNSSESLGRQPAGEVTCVDIVQQEDISVLWGLLENYREKQNGWIRLDRVTIL